MLLLAAMPIFSPLNLCVVYMQNPFFFLLVLLSVHPHRMFCGSNMQDLAKINETVYVLCREFLGVLVVYAKPNLSTGTPLSPVSGDFGGSFNPQCIYMRWRKFLQDCVSYDMYKTVRFCTLTNLLRHDGIINGAYH